MKTQKMSLANIQGKLSRDEMKNIMAGGDEEGIGYSCQCSDGHSAGMQSCDNYDCWCVQQRYGTVKNCS